MKYRAQNLFSMALLFGLLSLPATLPAIDIDFSKLSLDERSCPIFGLNDDEFFYTPSLKGVNTTRRLVYYNSTKKTGKIIKISNIAPDAEISLPALSPNGQTVYFVANEAGHRLDGKLYSLAKGSDQAKLLFPPQPNDDYGALLPTPDGKSLIFTRTYRGGAKFGAQFYIWNLDRRELRAISDKVYFPLYNPTISEDGSKIAFAVDQPDAKDHDQAKELLILNIETGQVAPVLRDILAINPIFLNDTLHLAYIGSNHMGFGITQQEGIFVSADGGGSWKYLSKVYNDFYYLAKNRSDEKLLFYGEKFLDPLNLDKKLYGTLIFNLKDKSFSILEVSYDDLKKFPVEVW